MSSLSCHNIQIAGAIAMKNSILKEASIKILSVKFELYLLHVSWGDVFFLNHAMPTSQIVQSA